MKKQLIAGFASLSALAVLGWSLNTNFISTAQQSQNTQDQLPPADAQKALELQQARKKAFEEQQAGAQTTPVEQQQPSIQPGQSQDPLLQDQVQQQQGMIPQDQALAQGQMPQSGPQWNGQAFTYGMDFLEGPSGYETPHTYDLGESVEYRNGIAYKDGYVVVYYNTNIRPKGSYIKTSLGQGIILGHIDIDGDPTHVGIAVK